MGESVGGTLSFTLFNYLKDKYENLPKQIIAYSPCMDTTLSNPEIEDYDLKDIMIHSYGCRKAIS